MNNWIPVFDRLPNKNGYYLVTVYLESINYYFVANWHFNNCKKPFWTECEPVNEKVVAWMDLPDPFVPLTLF